MPTYDFECSNGHAFERFLPLAEIDTPQTCECGQTGQLVISAPMLVWGQRECVYDSPIDGRAITSWKQRADDMARNGCQEYDPGMKQDYERRIEREQNALEAKIESSIEAEIERLPSRKRESLHNELSAGADAAPVRGSVPLKTVRSLQQ